MAGSLDSQKVRQWRRRMERFHQGRQSVTEFCRTEGVSAPSFYQWRKRLARQPRATEEASGFRAVRLAGTNAALVAAGVVVQLPGGTREEFRGQYTESSEDETSCVYRPRNPPPLLP